jgi:hypothetical protein
MIKEHFGGSWIRFISQSVMVALFVVSIIAAMIVLSAAMQ